MTSEQRAELIGGHADGSKDAAQGALEQILTPMDWHHGSKDLLAGTMRGILKTVRMTPDEFRALL